MAIGQGDIEAVSPAAVGVQHDRYGLRLVVIGSAERADHARPDETQRARRVRVLGCRELVVEFQRPIEGGR